MEIAETIFVTIVAVGMIMASLMILHTVLQVYECSIDCIKKFVVERLKAIWEKWL